MSLRARCRRSWPAGACRTAGQLPRGWTNRARGSARLPIARAFPWRRRDSPVRINRDFAGWLPRHPGQRRGCHPATDATIG